MAYRKRYKRSYSKKRKFYKGRKYRKGKMWKAGSGTHSAFNCRDSRISKAMWG